jgi:hypothetical protein
LSSSTSPSVISHIERCTCGRRCGDSIKSITTTHSSRHDTYRTHPVETLWRFFFAVVPIWLIAIPAQAVVIQRLLQATNGILEHANIRLWPPLDRVLSLVWLTPNVHKIHHSRAIHETNSNYANLRRSTTVCGNVYASRAREEFRSVWPADWIRRGWGPPRLSRAVSNARSVRSPDRKVRIEASVGR